MRSGHPAEWILSLLEPPERASSTVGDLMEEAAGRGPLWFWIQVTCTALILLWRGLTAAPLRMIGFAVMGWFGCMAASLVLWWGGFILVTLVWGIGYFFTHNTALDLLSNLVRLRFDWPPLSPGAMRWIGMVAMFAAPFQTGRFTARCWPRLEIAAWGIMAIIWPVMAVFVPFAAWSARVDLPVVLVVQTFVLLGVLLECELSRRAARVQQEAA